MAGRGRSRRWGWHRLVDPWPERIVDQAGVRSDQLVLDLGAGDGALVPPLLAAGARVLAIELHHGRAERLRSRFADPIGGQRLTVVETDLADLLLPAGPFHVVSNPPYAGATALIRTLTGRGSQLRTAHLVVPYGVACRCLERPLGDFDVSVAMRIPRAAFRPPPDVDSVLLRLVRRRAKRTVRG